MDIVDYEADIRTKDDDLDLSTFYGTLQNKPEIEQELFSLQDNYYSTNDENEKLDIWKKMFLKVRIYARSMVLQKLKNKTFLPPDEIDEKATTAAINFMSQYVNRLNFKVGASFGSMINFKVLEAVYNNEKEEKVKSLYLENDNKEIDLMALSKRENLNLLWNKSYDDINEENFESLNDIIHEFLNEADSEITSDSLKLKFRMYFLILLKNPKNYHTKDLFIKLNCTSKKEIDFLNLIEKTLYEKFLNFSYRD